MCGIVGAVAHRNVVPILIEGLRKLEYRGYDSAGIAVVNGTMARVRSVGRVADLQARTEQARTDAPTGIAHTRWATHGGVTENNAHPHYSEGGGVQVHALLRRSRLHEAACIADIVERTLAGDGSASIAILVQGRSHLVGIVAEFARRGVRFQATDIDAETAAGDWWKAPAANTEEW
jgi:hypothetical protein